MIIQQRDYLQLKEFISTDIISEIIEIRNSFKFQSSSDHCTKRKEYLEIDSSFFPAENLLSLATCRHTVNRVRKALWPRPKLIHD